MTTRSRHAGRYRLGLTAGESHDLLVRSYVLLAALSCGVGGVILAGGAERFSGPSFEGPRDLVAWLPLDAWVWWGTLFMAHGVALALALKRPLAVHMLRFGMVVYAFLAITFAASVFQEPAAAATGVIAYTGFAALALFASDHLEHHGWEG